MARFLSDILLPFPNLNDLNSRTDLTYHHLRTLLSAASVVGPLVLLRDKYPCNTTKLWKCMPTKAQKVKSANNCTYTTDRTDLSADTPTADLTQHHLDSLQIVLMYEMYVQPLSIYLNEFLLHCSLRSMDFCDQFFTYVT